MKFSEIDREQWPDLQPYLDTCLLPITGLSGLEQPYEATEALEKLRDMMDMIEIPFKGRVVTYPACHYICDDEHFPAMVGMWCRSLRTAGFKYIIIATIRPSLQPYVESADLWLSPNVNNSLPSPSEVSEAIRLMWSGSST